MNAVPPSTIRKDASTASRVSQRGLPASSACASSMGLGHLLMLRETLVLSCAVSAKISSAVSFVDTKASTRVEMNRNVSRRYGGGIRSRVAQKVGIHQPYKMLCHGAHRRSHSLRRGHHRLLPSLRVRSCKRHYNRRWHPRLGGSLRHSLKGLRDCVRQMRLATCSVLWEGPRLPGSSSLESKRCGRSHTLAPYGDRTR